jgi:multiple antibiotic resistance protein
VDYLATHFLTCFLGFFAIMNPLANTAVFVSLTANMKPKEITKTAFKSLFITFCIVVVFSVLGNLIFQLFGITIEALRIAGGILLFIIGYQMLHGDSSKLHSESNKTDSNIAISPLAVPILAGPGTLATAMNYAVSADINKIILTIIAFFSLCILTYICFVFGQKIIKIIGQGGLTIVTRLMGLIIAVIGVEMFISGIIAVIKHSFTI